MTFADGTAGPDPVRASQLPDLDGDSKSPRTAGVGDFPSQWQIDYLSQRGDAALVSRNQVIEWTFVVESALLVASLTLSVYNDHLYSAWGLSILAVAMLGFLVPLSVDYQDEWFTATFERAHLVRLRIRQILLKKGSSEGLAPDETHAREVVRRIEINGERPGSLRGLWCTVLGLGFAPLIVAALGIFGWLTWKAIFDFKLVDPRITSSAGFVATLAVLIVELGVMILLEAKRGKWGKFEGCEICARH
jgi:hypothetical protein